MKHLKTFEGLTKNTGFCDRCGQPTKSVSGSWLNTEMICPTCQEEEKNESDYQLAKDIEREEVRKGNYNYAGIRNK